MGLKFLHEIFYNSQFKKYNCNSTHSYNRNTIPSYIIFPCSTEQVTFFRKHFLVKEITEKKPNQYSLKLVEWLISGIADGITELIVLSFSKLVNYSN